MCVRLVTLEEKWANVGPRRKPFEITKWQPKTKAGDVLLIGPCGHGGGTGRRVIRGVATVGGRWRSSKTAIEARLVKGGYLTPLSQAECQALNAHIAGYRDDDVLYITELVEGRRLEQDVELAQALEDAGLRNAVPESSRLWPHLRGEAVAAALRAIGS